MAFAVPAISIKIVVVSPMNFINYFRLPVDPDETSVFDQRSTLFAQTSDGVAITFTIRRHLSPCSVVLVM